jgi:spermidine/putrescine transport system substrate-binding protein
MIGANDNWGTGVGGVRQVSRATAWVAATAALSVLAACGGGDGATSTSPDDPVEGTVRTFTYDDSIDPTILDPFEQAHPGVEVQTATFNSNAQAAAKIKGGFGTDVIEVCLDESSPLVDNGLLAPIDTSKITGWPDMVPSMQSAQGVTEDGKTWLVPLSAGPHGLIYDVDAFTEPPTSWADLYDPSLQGQVALDGGGGLTPLAVTALAMGIDDPMAMTPDQIAEVRDYMIDNRGQFRTFADSDSDTINLFKSGEITLTDGGLGTTAKLQKEGVNVEWVAPTEGALSWICGFGISSEAENVAGAYALINHYLSPEMQAVIASQGFSIVNPEAMPLIPKEDREAADPAKLESLIPEVEAAYQKEWDQAWQEIQVG